MLDITWHAFTAGTSGYIPEGLEILSHNTPQNLILLSIKTLAIQYTSKKQPFIYLFPKQFKLLK